MKLLLYLLLTTSFLSCEPEQLQYPWRCETIDEQWFAVEEELPKESKTIFALDHEHNLWVGYYKDGLFVAFTEEDDIVINPGVITHWKYITPLE